MVSKIENRNVTNLKKKRDADLMSQNNKKDNFNVIS